MPTFKHTTPTEDFNHEKMMLRLLSKIKYSQDCWEWTGYKLPGGYGQVFIGGNRKRMRLAHRVSYIVFRGPIPEGFEIDHLCLNKSCVNPDHLEAVTSQVNSLRGNTVARRQSSKTHCIRGHEFSLFNTRFTKKGNRQCHACVACRKQEIK